MSARGKHLLHRIIEAYKAGRPLTLKPGDVMYVRHLLEAAEVKTEEHFEAQAADGGNRLREKGEYVG